jgi:hypothetical protein
MCLNDLVFIDEIECYNEIIDCFLKSKNDEKKKELCKDHSIIKLMDLWDRRKELFFREKELLKNSLIFILALFEDEMHTPDVFSSIGKDFSSLENREREEFISILREEIR